MKIATSDPRSIHPQEPLSTPLSRLFSKLRLLLLSWETYLVIGIVLLAGFLRLYRIDSSTLDVDQTMIYRMARDAIQHGHLVATSNGSSIGNTNPPGAIYLMMLPALFTSDPLWGTIFLALLSTFSVLFTYLFTRRYYGFLTALSASLLYAVSHRSVAYARYIWQPNMMPFFVILFIWLLFRGVVERKSGWLAPALLLAGLIFQLHTTAILLLAPLLLALLLAPGTIRKRDIALGVLALVVVYAPYLLWEIAVHFQDIKELLGSGKTVARIDAQALDWYRTYIDPYDGAKPDTSTILGRLNWLLFWVAPVMYLLLLGGLLLMLLLPLWSSRRSLPAELSFLRKSWSWWLALRNSPYLCGLLVLFTWQVIPLLGFARHSLPIFRHYVMFTLPGQFIVIALCLVLVAHWFQVHGSRWQIGYLGCNLLLLALIAAQGLGTFATDLDQARGNYVDLYSGNLYHSDIGSMHNALNQAEGFAEQMHLNRIYITTDETQNGMGYLAEQVPTAVTTFDDNRCLILPSESSGPAIMLLGPHSNMARALLATFAHATLLASPRHLDGPPYQIYLVQPDSAPSAFKEAFPQNLQLLDTSIPHMTFQQNTYLVTRWNMQRPSAPSYRQTYIYNMDASTNNTSAAGNGQSWDSGGTCIFNAIRPGDHLLVVARAKGGYVPYSLNIKIQYGQTTPHLLHVGPLTFETGKDDKTPWHYLPTPDGNNTLTVPVGK